MNRAISRLGKYSSDSNLQGCCLTGTRAPGGFKLLAWATTFLCKEPKRAPKNLSEHGSFSLNIHINFVAIKLTLKNKTINKFAKIRAQ